MDVEGFLVGDEVLVVNLDNRYFSEYAEIIRIFPDFVEAKPINLKGGSTFFNH